MTRMGVDVAGREEKSKHRTNFFSFFIQYCTTSFIEVQQSAVKSTQPRVSLGYKLVKGADNDQSL